MLRKKKSGQATVHLEDNGSGDATGRELPLTPQNRAFTGDPAPATTAPISAAASQTQSPVIPIGSVVARRLASSQVMQTDRSTPTNYINAIPVLAVDAAVPTHHAKTCTSPSVEINVIEKPPMASVPSPQGSSTRVPSPRGLSPQTRVDARATEHPPAEARMTTPSSNAPRVRPAHSREDINVFLTGYFCVSPDQWGLITEGARVHFFQKGSSAKEYRFLTGGRIRAVTKYGFVVEDYQRAKTTHRVQINKLAEIWKKYDAGVELANVYKMVQAQAETIAALEARVVALEARK